jgi:glycogen synthase
MKVLFSSYVFDPSVGGLESVSKLLATKFAEAGNDVHVITQSPGGNIADAKYKLSRRPRFIQLVKLLQWCDLFFQNNISLRSLIPALLLGKPTLVVHQTWLQDEHGHIGWHNCVKHALLRFVTNVAVSNAIAGRLKAPSVVIGNPYDDTTFHLIPGIVRDSAIAFVGRLVSDKGVDVLLRALKFLHVDGLMPDVTIIGTGPEEGSLRALTLELGLDRQVKFAGKKTGSALAHCLNQYRILVVPSRLPEPFGVVALEGIACGCVIVGSEAGGLKEAIGNCGFTFPNGNELELAKRLKDLLLHPEREINLREPAARHLEAFHSDAVAASYLDLIRKTVA